MLRLALVMTMSAVTNGQLANVQQLPESMEEMSNSILEHLHPPTQGQPWPQPQMEQKSWEFYTYSPSDLVIKVKQVKKCNILEQAMKRFSDTLAKIYSLTIKSRRSFYKARPSKPAAQEPLYRGSLKLLVVHLTKPCEEYPYLFMDERYNVSISAQSTLYSDSIWGIMHGLETVSQLFYLSNSFTEVRINSTSIVDYPAYPHRGYMLDTARHHISVENILKTLDAMAMNKMNVFHWHMVADESFPYQSLHFPELSEKGAYHPTLVYTQDQIKHIIEFARNRGIRVIPEFDVTGNVRSWGASHPEIMIECFDTYYETAHKGPMHPTNLATYEFIHFLFEELQNLFPDKYFHVGGDEEDTECWSMHPDIIHFIEQYGLKSVQQVHSYFMINVLKNIHQNKAAVIWEDLYFVVKPIQKGSIVQLSSTKPFIKDQLIPTLINSSIYMVLSAPWYLDNENNFLMRLHSLSPRAWFKEFMGEGSKDLMLGGEASMWTATVDDTNLLSKSWPKASAVADLFWREVDEQPQLWENIDNTVERLEDIRPHNGASAGWLGRLAEHVCRMRRRGLPAEPALGPGFCVA